MSAILQNQVVQGLLLAAGTALFAYGLKLVKKLADGKVAQFAEHERLLAAQADNADASAYHVDLERFWAQLGHIVDLAVDDVEVSVRPQLDQLSDGRLTASGAKAAEDAAIAKIKQLGHDNLIEDLEKLEGVIGDTAEAYLRMKVRQHVLAAK